MRNARDSVQPTEQIFEPSNFLGMPFADTLVAVRQSKPSRTAQIRSTGEDARFHLPPCRMHPVPLWLLVIALLVLSARSAPSRPDFYDPRILGGEMLNNASRHGGEPLNVIISGLSTPSVLTNAGFLGYVGSLGFARECFGLHIGDRQPANLGDGNGWVDEMMVLRESYGSAALGTCWETVIGGNHLRVYRQDGPAAKSGALFLAVSQEESLLWHHTISRDGYNVGRDLLVQRATRRAGTSFKGVKYTTTARRIDDLMIPGKAGVNHNITIDGVVVLLTVTVSPSIESRTSKHLGLMADFFSLLFYVHSTYCMQNMWTVW
ncbi:Secreted protein [Mycena venus]|uniref:Secreted protein n=1 Tax=Mycena venus TaxID=2733690 RepID=A0A8H6YKU6_9AGAR|nr:Secreted protein [Mycena venus]